MAKRRAKPDDNLSLFHTAGTTESPPVGNTRPAASAATGGPSTVHGIDYQLKVAVYEAYRMMAEVLAAPFRDLTITLEARSIHEEGITRWDVGLGLPTRLLEIKLNANRADILEWLDRIAQTHDREAEFRLVYSSTSGTLEGSVLRLIRLAHESAADEQRFRKAARKEEIRDAELILRQLGKDALALLRRMALRPLPEESTGELVVFMSEMLCPTQPVALTRYLREQFLIAMQQRRTYQVRELIEESRKQGFALIAPQGYVYAELAPPLRIAVALLRHCTAGSPCTVLAETLQCSEADVPTLLTPLIEGRSVALDGSRWRLLIRPPEIPPDEERNALARGLKALLRYIKAHEAEPAARVLLLDAIQLTRICADSNPPAVIKTFRQLEQLLKRHGNKRLVLELAELTITAARDPLSRDEEAVRAEAQALICGRSWALQRLGDLAGAQKAGKDSLELGEAIDWDRNTAFCQKCNGRLARLHAEEEPNPTERAKYLDQSIDLLTAAIATFRGMNEVGPDHPEVGDCYSLIARTYLVGKQYAKAREALQEAYRRIFPKDAKDYLDLLILNGDVEVATGNYDDAENRYSEALAMPTSTDARVSEIFARGYLQRGKNRVKLGRTEGARADFACAVTIWRALEEYERAAQADWERIRLLEAVPEVVIAKFEESFSYLVRVTAYERYVREYVPPGAQTVGQRSTPSDVHLNQLLHEAKRSVRIKYPRP